MSTTEESLLDLVSYKQVATCQVDQHSQILQANPTFLELVGATQEEVQTGLSLHEFLDLPGRRLEGGQELQGRWTATIERELRCRDGSRLPVLIELSSLEQAAGCYVVKLIDLVAHQHAKNDALHAAAIIDSSDDAILSTDLNRIIRSWNRGAERLYGYLAREIVGKPISLLTPPELVNESPGRLGHMQENQPLTHYETVRMKKDGTRVTVSVTLSPVRDDNGAIVGASGIARDITDRKQMEEMVSKNQELMDQYRRVQEINRLKSEFLANMSHELRTPLNAIIGFSELLYDEVAGPLTGEQKDYLSDVLNSSKHLRQLITDVLDLAKIEAGKMTFHPESVDLHEPVDEVCNILRPLVAEKHLHLAVEIDPRLGAVTVDPAKLKQVLYNYLSNAIKFTPEQGQITLRLRAAEEDTFRLEVQDTGIGIASEDLERLFVEFQQLDASLVKRYQGTGLGLALTRRIVEAQGGRVGVHSIPNQGSTFFAVLPRVVTATVQREEEEEIVEPPLAQPEHPDAPAVLIIEDEPKDRRPLIQAFTDAGYHMEVAATGAQAVARCCQRSFDVVTLDLLLPDLSGWQVLKAIRGKGLNREVPVIVITMIEEKEIGLGFPIQEILNKPVQKEVLLASLERARAKKTRR